MSATFQSFLFSFFFLAPLGVMAENRIPPPPVVVVSLKPLHSWVCALMEGRGVPILLLKGRLSPHAAPLKPTDLACVLSADIMIWIGPSFEVSFKKFMQSLAAEKKLTLEDFPELDWLPQRNGGLWDHASHGDPTHGMPANHQTVHDGHIWMDPLRAEKIVALVAKKLGEKDPHYKALYEKNLKNLKRRLQALHRVLEQRFKMVQGRPFFVMHDAYQYLEKRYHLLAQGVILLSPENPPSLRHLQELKNRLLQQKKACVFIEPQFQSPLVIEFLGKLGGVSKGFFDPLGVDIPEGPLFYEQLMIQLATNFEACVHR